METQDYIKEYEEFQNNYKRTEISGEEIGEMIMRLAGYFAKYNMQLGGALRAFTAVKARLQGSVDEATGKAMSSSKAEVMSEATSEGALLSSSKIHVNNIQEYINALKALQRGVMFEYSQAQ